MKKIIPAVVVLLLTAGAFFYLTERRAKPPSYSGGDFVLHSKQGNVALADYRGRVVVLYFGYTSCPDICPTSLSLLAGAFRKLTEKERSRVAAIFVSVDPERDTLPLVWDYARQFDPLIVGVTGSPGEIQEAAAKYGVYYAKTKVDSAMGYVVDHSAATYLIDREGRLVKELSHGTPSEEVAQELRSLLK